MKNNNFEIIEVGKIKPLDWLHKQMKEDLEEGFVGCLDELVPQLFAEDDIYDKNRRGNKFANFTLGLARDEGIKVEELQWWNSETQSQYYDGLIRHAFLLDNEKYIEKSKKYIEKILNSADEDGYLGIYTEEARYTFKKDGGELWAQATLFRALLSYYELTKDERVVNAVIKATDLTIQKYKFEDELIFDSEQTHGLMFSDILEYLYKYTKEQKYLNYLEYLYDDYSHGSLAIGMDAQRKNVFNDDYKLKDHGVHAYEHLRTLASLAYLTHKKEYFELLHKYEEKVEKCITCSGGPIGDEWINELEADATTTGYEYCSLQELFHAYQFILEKSGDLKYADKMENIFINAAQGMRNPNESGIAYLKSDNSYSMEGPFHITREDILHEAHVRYKYSPTHQEAAVCCVPNAGRLPTYYVQSMWYKKNDGYVKTLYGSSQLNDVFDGTNICITEESEYPLNGSFLFKIKLDEKRKMKISFRIPSWCKDYEINTNKKYDISNNQIVFNCMWDLENEVKINFKFSFEENNDNKGNTFYTYGPLLLAMPLKSKSYVSREYENSKLRDVCYKLDDSILKGLKLHKDIKIKNKSNSWLDLKFETKAKNSDETIVLVPIGKSDLRQITF